MPLILEQDKVSLRLSVPSGDLIIPGEEPGMVQAADATFLTKWHLERREGLKPPLVLLIQLRDKQETWHDRVSRKAEERKGKV